jgi:integrase
VAEAGQAWIRRGEAEGLERVTLHGYRFVLNSYIYPYLGQVQLDQLTRDQVVDFLKEVTTTKTSDAAGRAVRHLKMILNYAVDAEWVIRNVALKLKASPSKRHRIANRKANLRIPTLADLRKMLIACERRDGRRSSMVRVRARNILLLLIETGMRPSEARGLPWRCVNLEKLEIEIEQRADAWSAIGPCKTPAGFRLIPISPRLASELLAWHEICPPSQEGLVFPTRDGKPISARCFYQEWKQTQLAAGLTRPSSARNGTPRHLPLFRQYDIRHFRASWWIYQRLDFKSLTSRLGHSSIQVTFDIYGHVITDAEKDQVMASALEDVLYAEATPTQHGIPPSLLGD